MKHNKHQEDETVKAAIFANTDMSFKSVFKATLAFYLAQAILTIGFLACLGIGALALAYFTGALA